MTRHITTAAVLAILSLLLSLLLASCSGNPDVEMTADSFNQTEVAQTTEAPASDLSVQPETDSIHQSLSAEQEEALIEKGRRLLHASIYGILVMEDVFEPEWDFENEVVRLEEDRFPDWARDQYPVCLYWEAPMTRRTLRIERNPGESRWFVLPGKSWGWILVREEEAEERDKIGSEIAGSAHEEASEEEEPAVPSYHVLELGHEWAEVVDRREGFQKKRGVFTHIDNWGPF